MANLDTLKDIQKINEALKAQRDYSLSINDIYGARARQEEINLNNQLSINEQARINSEIKKGNLKLTEDEKKELSEIEKSQKSINTELTKEQKQRRIIIGTISELNKQLKIGWQYLMQSDKLIKSTILSLGMSGAKAEMMRGSFEQSAGFVARLGGSLEDVQSIMVGFADETGRARALSSEMIKDITLIGKETGLGIEQATKLGAQFELMGIDVKGTMEYVQGIVDTSERMGVNTTKVLKNVNDNFKKLNTYTFQQGVKGFAQMAMYAEKFKIDIGQALNAADVAKSLEGAVDLAAQLQIMGGEFAKTDPFQMLFLSRNDPAKFTEKIADMTKGLVTFRKMSDGTFEKFISPADRDRMAAVAKSLGMESSELTQIAERQSEIQKMRQEMLGAGLSPKDKELIEGMAIFNSHTGKFAVQIGSISKNISDIGASDLKLLQTQKVSLDQRALDAQTFEDAFKSTIAELKSALLPILRAVNGVLTAIRPTVITLTEWFTKGPGGWAKVAGLFVGAGLLWKGITFSLQKLAMGRTGFLGHIMGNKPSLTPTPGSPSGLFEQRKGIGEGALAKGQGIKNLGTGAGIGAAALGMGAGIGLAAVGISKLADSMSKLTKEQAKNLKDIAVTMAITFPLSAIGIGLVAGAAEAGVLGLLALGAAFVGIGFGVKLASEGIGKMSFGLAELNKSGGGAGKQLLGVAAGIGAITLAMGAGGIVGLFTFNNSLTRMANKAIDIEKIGTAFNNINTVLSGSKDNYIAIQNAIDSISKINIRGGGVLADLGNLLKNPLKVEFAENQVSMVSDITLNIDGQKFMQKVIKIPALIQRQESFRIGKPT